MSVFYFLYYTVLRVIVVRTTINSSMDCQAGSGWSSRVHGSVVTPPAPTPLLLVSTLLLVVRRVQSS
jgi:hypothetical protein